MQGGNRHYCGQSLPPRFCCGWGMELDQHLKTPDCCRARHGTPKGLWSVCAGPLMRHSGTYTVLHRLSLRRTLGAAGTGQGCTQRQDVPVPPEL